MQFDTLMMLLLFCFPFFSSFANGINIALCYRNKTDPYVDRIKKLLIVFYTCTGAIWLSVILLQFNWNFYTYISSFYYSLSLLWATLFYQFVFYMTLDNKNDSFSILHYIPPGLFFVVLIISPFFRPLNINFQLLNEQIVVDPTYGNSSFLLYPLAIFRRIFLAAYGILCFRRLLRMKKTGNYPHAHWLWFVWGVYCIIFIVTLLRLFDYYRLWPIIVYTVIMAVSLVVMQTVICFNILEGKYKLKLHDTQILPDSGKRKYTNFQQIRYKSYKQKKKKVAVVIDRAEFEIYFKQKKPYLNSNFKIDDLVDEFHACRSIISTFVNKTYGMSFSWYVNNWRLKEVERLGKLKSNKNKDTKELVSKAGFGSYRNYLRTKSFFENTHNPT